MRFSIIALCAVLPVLSACGTMNVGTTQKISFSSNVDGVVIYNQDYQVVCTAPCTAELRRRANELFLWRKNRDMSTDRFAWTQDLKAAFSVIFWRPALRLLSARRQRRRIWLPARRMNMNRTTFLSIWLKSDPRPTCSNKRKKRIFAGIFIKLWRYSGWRGKRAGRKTGYAKRHDSDAW